MTASYNNKEIEYNKYLAASGSLVAGITTVSSNSSSAIPTYPNYQTAASTYPDVIATKNINNSRYTIEINIKSDINNHYYIPTLCIDLYSESEFIASFVHINDAMSNNKKFAITACSIYNIEDIKFIHYKEYKDGIARLLSPYYILERAKELNYV